MMNVFSHNIVMGAASPALLVAVDGCLLWLPTPRIAMIANAAPRRRRDVAIANAKVNAEECERPEMAGYRNAASGVK
jgi:hypothetical protein